MAKNGVLPVFLNCQGEYEAKFSAQFVVATCLIKGAFGLADLMPAALRDPVVLDLTRRVTCAIDPDTAFPAYFSGGVRVTLNDGRSLVRHVRINSGAGERALDADAVSKKFLASASLSIPLAQAERMIARELTEDERRELAQYYGGQTPD